MRAVLFDLGNTLVDDNEVPLPGALELLEAVRDLRDPEGHPVLSGLVSNWTDPGTPAEVEAARQEYYQILRSTGIDIFFEPLRERVTLSTEAGVAKPDAAIFRLALDRLEPGLHFHHAIFVTENAEHVSAARLLGMMALH